MDRSKPSPLRLVAIFLAAVGLFSVFYPAFFLLASPGKEFATHHVCFMIAALVLLPTAWLMLKAGIK